MKVVRITRNQKGSSSNNENRADEPVVSNVNKAKPAETSAPLDSLFSTSTTASKPAEKKPAATDNWMDSMLGDTKGKPVDLNAAFSDTPMAPTVVRPPVNSTNAGFKPAAADPMASLFDNWGAAGGSTMRTNTPPPPVAFNNRPR
jgi:hypothetical protein